MNCIEGTQQITQQIIRLLSLLEDKNYAQPLEVFNGSSLGQHFRHILDFYRCLVQGAEAGLIDYANRTRDPLIEQSAAYASLAFSEVAEAVKKLDESASIPVKADFSSQQQDRRPEVHSSLGRELMFAHDHAVHHLAIIKIGLQQGFPHVPVEHNLGIAPSTVKYRTTNG